MGRTLYAAVGASLLLLLPCALLLREGEPAAAPPAPTTSALAVPAPEAPPAPTPSPSPGLELAPPPPQEAPRPTRPAPVVTPERPLAPTARLVALRKLEERRPEETVDAAEELVRDLAEDPTERTVLLGALGILSRVPGGDGALMRLASRPPTPEVAELAESYLERRR
ncbi:MAG: hypothetical protein M9894_32160 [Planctomycetes bacterium]|nr:hypothetical protein [Planctomycetota bacterium]